MRICLYNSFNIKEEGKFDKIIWCPLSGDIINIIRFFRDNAGKDINLQVESVFRKFLLTERVTEDTPGISFFEINKTEKPFNDRLIAFYSQSDTLAGNTYKIISNNPACRIVNFVPSGKTENSDEFFRKKNITFLKYSFRHLRKVNPDILVLYNDWTKAAIRIIAQCRFLGIPVICIQESILDFGDSFRRMQHADNVMIQGPRTVFELPRKHFYLTGNPRYAFPDKQKHIAEYVLINCNFTYNVHEEVRYKWLDDVTSSIDELGFKYLISQHPRDNGNLSKFKNHIKSSSSTMKQQLEKAGLVITRFSSIIHESLIEGVPVIYYNPHHEQMQYDFEFNPEFLLLAEDKILLKEFSYRLFKKNISGEKLKFYLNSHCLPSATKPVDNINLLLSGNEFRAGRFCITDLLHILLYYPFMVNFVTKIKTTFKNFLN